MWVRLTGNLAEHEKPCVGEAERGNVAEHEKPCVGEAERSNDSSRKNPHGVRR